MKVTWFQIQQTNGFLVKEMFIFISFPLLVINATDTLPYSYADGGGIKNCYNRGFVDGQDHPFNQGTFDKCGEDYYHGFVNGCLSVKGNSGDICESAADA